MAQRFVDRVSELEFANSLTDLARFILANPNCTDTLDLEDLRLDLQIILENLKVKPVILKLEDYRC